ncbi:MAG: T9SS type A sorting domain-containing protein [Bacteroidales bacterium]|nr:T9SS type A sorting domain-containing protein [Bacteroidales bacterium]
MHARSLLFAGKRLTQTGIYKDVQKTYQGADSTIVLNLTINKAYSLSKDTTLMSDQSIQFGMQEITKAGTYTEQFYTQAGCDSIVTLNVKMIVTGLKENDSDRITVYPINAQNEIHVEFQGEALLIVTDILGRVVLQTKAHKKHTFQLDQLPEGIYIVFVKQNEIEHKLFEIRR